MALFIPFFLMTTLLSVWTVNIAKQLDRARITESALQVSEERLRFAQELHDTLGQRLAAISVKTELARALAVRGDDRLDAELAELQSLASASVTEMHDVVEGYRTVNLSTEITGSRELLESAGITLTVEGDPTALPGPLREIAAWLVREATTNVVKHSDAEWVRLTLAPDTVTVTNDGVAVDIDRLSGLAGIRRRAEPSGASLVAERDGSLFTVTLRGADQ
jgi:two-component system sensor histidine kinase DesK